METKLLHCLGQGRTQRFSYGNIFAAAWCLSAKRCRGPETCSHIDWQLWAATLDFCPLRLVWRAGLFDALELQGWSISLGYKQHWQPLAGPLRYVCSILKPKAIRGGKVTCCNFDREITLNSPHIHPTQWQSGPASCVYCSDQGDWAAN